MFNGYINGNQKQFNLFCLFGFHDFSWSKGSDEKGDQMCVARCIKCNEIRALSSNNHDMHDMNEVRKTIGVGKYSPIYFSWEYIDFNIDNETHTVSSLSLKESQ